MANRYPIVANASTLTLEEIPASDTLLLDAVTISGNVDLGAIGNITITGGNLNEVLKTDGNGVLSWGTDSASPAGTNTQVQFNNNGAFGACAAMTFNTSTSRLTVTQIQGTNVTSTGNLTASNIVASGNITASANVTSSGNLIASNVIISTEVTVNGGANVDWSAASYAIFRTQDNNTKFAALTGPSNISGANGTYVAWALPATSGNVNEFVTTDGAGNMVFATVASSSAPTSNVDPGQPGTIAFDSGNIYVCIATDTWKKASLSDF